MGDETVTVRAPAKLTTRLRIVGVREDGYHLLDAEMVELELADEVTIDPHGTGISATGRHAPGTPLDASNLVAQALRLVGRTAGVHLAKWIPHGGGLGGGSADAAAVLRWAGWTDVVGSAALGADVPFCLVGGRAHVGGIGDLVEPLPPLPTPLPLTLVVPPLRISTPAAYRMWDELGGPSGSDGNDLEPAALAVEPELAVWRKRLIEITGAVPRLAGSGATWFLEGHHAGLAEALAEAEVILTSTRS